MSWTVDSSLTSPSAYIRLQILITSILPSSLPSHALCTPSGPHHMLPEVLSLDTGSAPPGMTRALTVHTSPPASQIYSPCAHLPFWANASLMVPPFLPLSDGRAPQAHSPWPLPFTLQLECHGLQFHSKVELCLLSEHPGRGNLVLGASVGSRIWLTCFLGDLWPLARPPHQPQLPSDKHSTCHLGLLTTCKLALLLFLLVTPWSLLPGAVTVCAKASWEPRARLLVTFSVWCTSTPTSTFQ